MTKAAAQHGEKPALKTESPCPELEDRPGVRGTNFLCAVSGRSARFFRPLALAPEEMSALRARTEGSGTTTKTQGSCPPLDRGVVGKPSRRVARGVARRRSDVPVLASGARRVRRLHSGRPHAEEGAPKRGIRELRSGAKPRAGQDGKAPPALPEDEWTTWTYEEMLGDIRSAAKGMIALGLP